MWIDTRYASMTHRNINYSFSQMDGFIFDRIVDPFLVN